MDSFERRDLFHKAADLLEKEVWIKGRMAGTLENGREAYCMVGALRMVAYGTAYPDDLEDMDDEEPGCEERYGDVDATTMIHWNDEIAESVGEVVARLRQMAAGEPVSWKE